MILVNSLAQLEDHVDRIVELSSNQIAVKIKSPIVKIDGSLHNPFRHIVSGFSEVDTEDSLGYIIVPLIEQYYHNFFEVFSRILLLRNTNERFGIIFVRDDKREHGVFCSMIRGHVEAERNASYILDFLKYFNIQFTCMSTSQLEVLRDKSIFVILDSCTYPEPSDIFQYNEKSYGTCSFLSPIRTQTHLENVEVLRSSFPTYSVVAESKIFISRSKAKDRRYSLERELEERMKRNDYRIVHLEDLDLLEQIKMVQEASRIVCLYGSALVNTSLCSKNTKILAINYTPGYYVNYMLAFDKYRIPYTQIDVLSDETMVDIEGLILNWETS